MSKHMYSTANLSDKELKEQGNRMFSLRKYEEAISCYSKAIVSFSNNSNSNLTLHYKKLLKNLDDVKFYAFLLYLQKKI